MTFQTEWMAEQLVRRDQYGKVYSGGLLSDVTYQFFNHGYLLTTSMYSEVLHRWIPIQLTWMWGLEEGHYRAHFTTLLRQISKADLTYHKRDLLVQQVVDFSAAQRKGFVSAYMDVFNENDPSKALSKLHGCHEHFRQSVTRIKKNRNIVNASQLVGFSHLSYNILSFHFIFHLNDNDVADLATHLVLFRPSLNVWLLICLSQTSLVVSLSPKSSTGLLDSFRRPRPGWTGGILQIYTVCCFVLEFLYHWMILLQTTKPKAISRKLQMVKSRCIDNITF
jgi:hypothetical protein